ncbi:MAG: SDR family oxidoreductase [Mesorhizobium sp.]|nr:SDR family oxidoreductase [Mesorhizobium sp.]
MGNLHSVSLLQTKNASRESRSGQRSDFSPKRILVTGGAGFLGSHLCETLLREGHHVICVDNFFTGSQRNIGHLVDFATFKAIRHDVVEPIDLEVDEIYNLACPASPPHYQADPIHTTKTSVLGALNLLELAVRLQARIFHASTSEVYGDPEVHPQVESYWGNVNPFGPRACYDEGKRVAETLFHDFHHRHGVEIRIARIFNTYGPRMRPDDGRVVSNFIVQALKGEDITIYGDGSQTRSFCYVDDLIDGFRRLMDAPASLNRPVNLGNPGEFTIRQLAELVIEQTGSSSKIVHRPLPVDDPTQRRPDISLAMRELEWQPQIPLVTGLQKTIAYFEGVLAETSPALIEVA